MWVKVRVTEEQRTRWHRVAEARGVSLSELVRRSLDGVRAVRRRHQPRSVDPELLRELARLIELDRELAQIRKAHERAPASAPDDPPC